MLERNRERDAKEGARLNKFDETTVASTAITDSGSMRESIASQDGNNGADQMCDGNPIPIETGGEAGGVGEGSNGNSGHCAEAKSETEPEPRVEEDIRKVPLVFIHGYVCGLYGKFRMRMVTYEDMMRICAHTCMDAHMMKGAQV